MFIRLAAAVAVLALAACSEKPPVRLVSGEGKVQTAARSEPVFFNGQHYKVDYSFNQSANIFDVKVSGTTRAMKQADRKSAVEIGTSAVRHFACPKGMSGALAGEPAFAAGTWEMRARCA